MAWIWPILSAMLRGAGWILLSTGGLLTLWLVGNLGSFWRSALHRAGESHWFVVAIIFYATPALGCLASGGAMLLAARFCN